MRPLSRYWTVVRRHPISGETRSEWIRTLSPRSAVATQTAVTNAGYSETLAVFSGKHFNRLED